MGSCFEMLNSLVSSVDSHDFSESSADWKKRMRENSGKILTIGINKGAGIQSKILTIP